MRRRVLAAALIAIVAAAASAPFLYERGYIRLNYPRRGAYPVRGVDVSVHQGLVDWDVLVKTTRIEFAYIKSSEGSRLRDDRFQQNWSASQGRLARGAYHFFTFCSDGAGQAQNFIDAVPNAGELPPAVDIEFAGNCTSWTSLTAIRKELRTFLNAVEHAAGRTPILYVTKESFARIVRRHFDGYPLWVRDVVFHPSLKRFPTMKLWQYAGNGRATGVTTLIDLNAFVGSRRDFESLVRP